MPRVGGYGDARVKESRVHTRIVNIGWEVIKWCELITIRRNMVRV